MPAIVVAVAAAAIGTAATAGAGALLLSAGGAFVTAAGTLSLLGVAASAIVGGVVAVGVSYGASSILGLNKPQKGPAQAAATSAFQEGEDRRTMIRSSVEPRRVVYGFARVSGPLIYATSAGGFQEYLHVVVPVATHPIHRFARYVINDVVIDAETLDVTGMVTTGPLAGKVRIRGWDGRQSIADPDLVAETSDGWSSAHVGFNVAYIYVRLTYDQDVFPNGLQNVAADVYGRTDIYNPTNGMSAYAENSALCILDYLRSDFGLACDDDEIDFPSFVTAANICQESVQVAEDGSTQPRYALGGSFKLDRRPIDIIDDMLATCGGALVYVQGKYRLHVAAYEAPTDTLTVSDLAGDVELITRPPRRDLFNSVRGTYVAVPKNFQVSEFPPVSDAAYVAEDGETIWKDIDLNLVNDGIRAQRLARLALRRSRESLTLKAPVRYAGIRYVIWQTLAVTMADFGWTDKPFRIVNLTFDPQSAIFTLTLREESAGSYAWDYDAANGYTAPNTSLVNPFSIPAPAGLTVSEEIYVTSAGAGVQTRAVLEWLAPAHPFVVGYDVQIREAASTEWRSATPTQGQTRATVDGVPADLFVWRVRARSTVAVGAWAEVQQRTGLLIAQPPTAVTGLSVQSISGLAFLRWDRHPDLDVRIGGRIEFRHSPTGAGGTWETSTTLGQSFPGDATFAVLPLLAGTYLAKAVDAGGRYSSTAASIGSSQATALSFANVDTIAEAPDFLGTHSNTVEVSSTLRLGSGGDVDDEADFDAIPDLDLLGGVAASGTYDFASGLDLGAVQNIRLTATLAALVVNTLDSFDARTQPIDEWLSFDGVAGGESDAWVEVRFTEDDPGGSPSWSPWQRLDASEFRARAFQFRVRLRSYDRAFNIHISTLSVTADEVA